MDLAKSKFTGGSDSKESTCNAGDPDWEDPLEKRKATHSSILAWRIPWTEEPGGLQVQAVAKRPMQLKQLSTQAQDSLAL